MKGGDVCFSVSLLKILSRITEPMEERAEAASAVVGPLW